MRGLHKHRAFVAVAVTLAIAGDVAANLEPSLDIGKLILQL